MKRTITTLTTTLIIALVAGTGCTTSSSGLAGGGVNLAPVEIQQIGDTQMTDEQLKAEVASLEARIQELGGSVDPTGAAVQDYALTMAGQQAMQHAAVSGVPGAGYIGLATNLIRSNAAQNQARKQQCLQSLQARRQYLITLYNQRHAGNSGTVTALPPPSYY